MELKDFVEDTLMQIVIGVKSAQGKAQEYGAIVNPMEGTTNTVQINNKSRSVEKVEFEVVLSETKSGNEGGKVSVDLMNFVKASIGGDGNRESGTRTNIRFGVPIVLPGIDNGNVYTQYKRRTDVPGDGLATF